MPDAKETGWILHSHGQGRKFGPLSEDELRSYFRAGMVKSVDRLAAPGDPVLHAAADVAAALGESVPVGPPPPPAQAEAPKAAPPPLPLPPVVIVPPRVAGGDGDGDAEARAARAAAAMNINVAAMMSTSGPPKKSMGWLGPVLVVVALVILLIVGLNMLRKLKPPSAVPQATTQPMADTPPPTAAFAPATNPGASEPAPGSAPALAAAASAPTEDSVFQANLAKAGELKAASDWAGLVSHASQWAQSQPDRIEPQQFLAAAYLGLGNYGEATVPLRKILARIPGDAATRAQLAQAYDQTQRYGESAELYKQMVADAPNDAVAWNNYGSALGGSGQQAQARVALENAVRIDPSMKPAWTNLGNLYLQMGDKAKAQVAFANAR